MEENQNLRSITLFEVIIIFLKYKKNILISTLVICIISVVLYFFVFDLIYFSSASVRSTGKSGGLLGSLSSGLPDIGGLEDLGLSTGKSAKDLANYEDILMSRRCLEPVIVKFDLMNKEHYQFMEDAVKSFTKEKMVLEENKLAGTLDIGIYDKDPVIAKEIVDYLLLQLDNINIELNVQTAKNNREFIEKRYFQAREDLTRAEDTLKTFQMIYGVAPDLQIKAAAQSVFALEAELKTEEVKLDVLKKILSQDQPEVKMEESKVSSLKDKIAGIQTSTDLNDILSLGNSPQIAMSFLRLEREVEIQSKILTFLLPVYEQAKIEEKKETPTIIVLDKAYVAEKKTKPKRLTMVFLFTAFGFFGSVVFFVLKYKWKKYTSVNSFKVPADF